MLGSKRLIEQIAQFMARAVLLMKQERPDGSAAGLEVGTEPRDIHRVLADWFLGCPVRASQTSPPLLRELPFAALTRPRRRVGGGRSTPGRRADARVASWLQRTLTMRADASSGTHLVTQGPAETRSGQSADRRHLPLAPRAPSGQGVPLAAPRDLDRHFRPRFAVWELTLACTSRCRHCGSRAGAPRPEELTTDECLRVAGELADLGVIEVSLIGGEAFLHPGFFDVVAALSRRGVKVAIATGGVGLDATLARTAAEAGLSSASVSIDGLGKTHDAVRGVKRGFEQALQALDHLRAADIYVGINSQIHRRAIDEIELLSELVIEQAARAWQVALTVPMGNAADRPELLLQPHDLLRVVPALARAKERLSAAGILLYPGNNVGYFGPHEHALRGSGVGRHYTGCSAGRSVVGIEADGTVKGCPSLPTRPYGGGSLREHSLLEIWERAPALRINRESRKLFGYCACCATAFGKRREAEIYGTIAVDRKLGVSASLRSNVATWPMSSARWRYTSLAMKSSKTSSLSLARRDFGNSCALVCWESPGPSIRR